MKKKIRDMYNAFVKEHGHAPHYVDGRIQFRDVSCEGDVTFKLSLDEDVDDDEIFYYCDGIDDLIFLLDDPMEEFVLLRVYEFYD